MWGNFLHSYFFILNLKLYLCSRFMPNKKEQKKQKNKKNGKQQSQGRSR